MPGDVLLPLLQDLPELRNLHLGYIDITLDISRIFDGQINRFVCPELEEFEITNYTITKSSAEDSISALRGRFHNSLEVDLDSEIPSGNIHLGCFDVDI